MHNARLRQWRASQAMTQEQAAESLGFSRRQYQRLESGESPIRKPMALFLDYALRDS